MRTELCLPWCAHTAYRGRHAGQARVYARLRCIWQHASSPSPAALQATCLPMLPAWEEAPPTPPVRKVGLGVQ